jgi:hypothetical protein
MLKKLVLWGTYSVFLGLLLAGAMYRTSVKLGDGEQNQNRGNQYRQESYGTGGGQSASESAIVSAQAEEHTNEIKETSIVASQVLDISNRGITLQLVNGSTVSVMGRAWRYAQTLGFTTQVSNTLWLEGFYESDRFEILRMTNLETKQSISLRDETGHPLWNGN